MAVVKISVDALSALEKEIAAISSESQQLNSRLRSAIEMLSSSWTSEEVDIIVNKLNEMYLTENQKTQLLDSVVQLIASARESYEQTDSSLAESIRGLFK